MQPAKNMSPRRNFFWFFLWLFNSTLEYSDTLSAYNQRATACCLMNYCMYLEKYCTYMYVSRFRRSIPFIPTLNTYSTSLSHNSHIGFALTVSMGTARTPEVCSIVSETGYTLCWVRVLYFIGVPTCCAQALVGTSDEKCRRNKGRNNSTCRYSTHKCSYI